MVVRMRWQANTTVFVYVEETVRQCNLQRALAPVREWKQERKRVRYDETPLLYSIKNQAALIKS